MKITKKLLIKTKLLAKKKSVENIHLFHFPNIFCHKHGI